MTVQINVHKEFFSTEMSEKDNGIKEKRKE